jgi:hypothetical protein
MPRLKSGLSLEEKQNKISVQAKNIIEFLGINEQTKTQLMLSVGNLTEAEAENIVKFQDFKDAKSDLTAIGAIITMGQKATNSIEKSKTDPHYVIRVPDPAPLIKMMTILLEDENHTNEGVKYDFLKRGSYTKEGMEAFVRTIEDDVAKASTKTAQCKAARAQAWESGLLTAEPKAKTMTEKMKDWVTTLTSTLKPTATRN